MADAIQGWTQAYNTLFTGLAWDRLGHRITKVVSEAPAIGTSFGQNIRVPNEISRWSALDRQQEKLATTRPLFREAKVVNVVATLDSF
jgi:hypothetical protein